MTNIPPLSDLTIITVALGIFFLVVAFYKSIFHKRRPPVHTTVNQTQPAVELSEDQPVKLADPYQQASANTSTTDQKVQQPAAAIYPFYPQASTATVSAFRQFTPQKEVEPSAASQPKEEPAPVYVWE